MQCVSFDSEQGNDPDMNLVLAKEIDDPSVNQFLPPPSLFVLVILVPKKIVEVKKVHMSIFFSCPFGFTTIVVSNEGLE